jgi:hypothetical protein
VQQHRDFAAPCVALKSSKISLKIYRHDRNIFERQCFRFSGKAKTVTEYFFML